MSFDPITYAMAKAYSDKKGGYVEPGKVYTYAGNISNEDGGIFVKISDDTPDVTNIKSVTVVEEGNATVISSDALTFGSYDGFPAAYFGDTPLVLAGEAGDQSGIVKGLFVVNVNNDNQPTYVSRIEFEETIHPIDPKFLPETRIVMDLPVDMETLFSGIDLPLNGDMAASLDRVAENLLPVYLRVTEYMSSGDERKYNIRLECEATYYGRREDGFFIEGHSFIGMFSEGVAVIHYNPNNATINGSIVMYATE